MRGIFLPAAQLFVIAIENILGGRSQKDNQPPSQQDDKYIQQDERQAN